MATDIKYMIPTAPHEATIGEVFKWLLDVEPLKPKELIKLSTLTDKEEQLNYINSWKDSFIKNELTPFLVENLRFWSSLPLDIANNFSIEELLEVYEDTQKAMYSTPKYKYTEVFKVGGELFSLCGPNMSKSILFQYAEADQEESNLLKSEGNLLYLIPVLMALFLRKKGEPLFFSTDQVKQRQRFFEGANMAQGWQVFNYFQETKKAVKAKFGKTLFSAPTSKERKAGVKGLQDSFGWLLTIKSLAEKKIFDLQGFNSQDSVLNTNTWECLTHLSVDNAIGAYQERLYKID